MCLLWSAVPAVVCCAVMACACCTTLSAVLRWCAVFACPASAPLLPTDPTPFSLVSTHQVPDVEAPGFWDRMDRMVGYNTKVRRALGLPGGGVA